MIAESVKRLLSCVINHGIFCLLILTSVLTISISICFLVAGYNTVFQNLFYIPIIIACIYYTWKGLLYSCFLSLSYFILIIMYNQQVDIFQLALERCLLFVFIAGVITIISKNRDAIQRDLIVSEERYHSLFINMQEGYIFCKIIPDENERPIDFIYLEVNDAFKRLTGLDEVIGKRASEVIPGFPQDNSEFMETYNRVSKSCIPESIEIYVHPLSSIFLINIYCPKSGYFVAVFENITDQRNAEEALRESNQKLRILTGLVRHDIFNQLQVLYLSLHIAMDSPELSEVREYITKARESGSRIEEIIMFTRDYENFGSNSSEWLTLHTTIETAKHEVNLGQIHVRNEVPKNLQIYADPIIRKIFTTLMENAVRHGGQISEITFSAIGEGESFIIIGEDNGSGIPVAEKELIFKLGFGKHTGIGLFLTREILAITGLSIRETGEEGKGARFEILLPAGKYRFNNEET